MDDKEEPTEPFHGGVVSSLISPHPIDMPDSKSEDENETDDSQGMPPRRWVVPVESQKGQSWAHQQGQAI